ncbi:MAG: hypothetical protein ACFB0Z_09305 [Candidatus Phaeomarinobacter sp.]
MLVDVIYGAALLASLLWFSAGLRYFGFQHYAAAKVMVPKSARSSPVFDSMAAGVRFLGGFNGAFALLCVCLFALLLTGSPHFTSVSERAVVLLAIAAAHISQFIGNVPILRNGERQGERYWPVMSGPMRFIFFMDAAQFALAGAAIVAVLVAR